MNTKTFTHALLDDLFTFAFDILHNKIALIFTKVYQRNALAFIKIEKNYGHSPRNRLGALFLLISLDKIHLECQDGFGTTAVIPCGKLTFNLQHLCLLFVLGMAILVTQGI